MARWVLWSGKGKAEISCWPESPKKNCGGKSWEWWSEVMWEAGICCFIKLLWTSSIKCNLSPLLNPEALCTSLVNCGYLYTHPNTSPAPHLPNSPIPYPRLHLIHTHMPSSDWKFFEGWNNVFLFYSSFWISINSHWINFDWDSYKQTNHRGWIYMFRWKLEHL